MLVNRSRMRRRSKWRRRNGLALLLALNGVACGTQVEGRSPAPQAPTAGVGAEDSAPVASEEPSHATITPEQGAVGAVTPPSTTRDSVSTPRPNAANNLDNASGTALNPRSSKPPQGTGGSSSDATPSGPPSPVAAPAPARPSTSTPLIFASVGSYSGPAGTVLLPVVHGAQLWVKHINQHGGLQGHPVELIVYDDGADPARHRANVQDAVEKRRVLAFLAQAGGVTGAAAVEYVTSNRVPVVGSEGATPGMYISPMYFPQMTSDEQLFDTWVYSTGLQAAAAKQSKLALFSCAEAPPCKATNRSFKDHAAEAGLDVVYNAAVSLAQPDFTAECLNARRAGAEIVFVASDGNSVTRVASSCARQGYRPTYATGGSIIRAEHANDPNLDGMIASTTSFPSFQTGTPAVGEFQAAVSSFGQTIARGQGNADGWTAGKLLEAASAPLRERPSREALLEGLWSVQDNRLGGLTAAPLSFDRDKPAQRQACFFMVRLTEKRFTSSDGFAPHCHAP